MELGATTYRARSAACAQCPLAALVRVGRPRRGLPPGHRRPRPATLRGDNRWVRGQVVAALATGGGLPAEIGAERLVVALEGLVREGLVTRDGQEHSLG